MKRFAWIVVLALALLVAILSFNAWRAGARSGAPEPRAGAALAKIDSTHVAEHLAQAIRIRTVSRTNEPHHNRAAFLELHSWLETTYPSAHRVLSREVIGGESLLYVWTGSDTRLPPAAFLAHMDVVPMAAATEDDWTHPPFSGRIEDGYVYGRGSLDMKSTLVTLMEGVEILTARGFQPQRTIYLAFGHDEEVGGGHGAARIAATLASRDVHLAWTLDEGGIILEGALPGLDEPIAMVAVAEKGYVTLEIRAHADGGHSAMPERDPAVPRLAEAILALQAAPFPAHIDGITAGMLDRVAEKTPFLARIFLANRWLFGPLFEFAAGRDRSLNSMTRTTIAPTMLRASPQENVLPQTAIATVNFRIYPGETIDTVLEHVRSVAASEFVEVELADQDFRSNPSRVADSESLAYQRIASSIRSVSPASTVIPGLLTAGTDSRHYEDIADDNLRFAAMKLSKGDTARIHGSDERISIDSLENMVHFYLHFIEYGMVQ